MKKLTVKSQWQGKVAVRDRYLREVKEKRDGLEIHLREEIMVIPFEELEKKIAGISKEVATAYKNPTISTEIG